MSFLARQAIVNEESGMGSLPEKEQASQSDAGPGEASINFGLAIPTTQSARIHARRIKLIRPPTFSISTIFDGVRILAQYSDLLYTLSLFRLNVRYKQSVLGWAWALLPPLALMGIYTVIFSRVATITTGRTPYPRFLFLWILPLIFFFHSIASVVDGTVFHS